MKDDNIPPRTIVPYDDFLQYKDRLKTHEEERRELEDDNIPSGTITSYVDFKRRMTDNFNLKTQEEEKWKMAERNKAMNALSTIKSNLEPSLLEIITKAEEKFEISFIHTIIPDPVEKSLILGSRRMNRPDNYSAKIYIPIVGMEAMYQDFKEEVKPEEGVVLGPEIRTFNTMRKDQAEEYCDVISINTIHPINNPKRFNEIIPGLATTANNIYPLLKELNLIWVPYDEKKPFLKVVDEVTIL